MLPDRVSNPGLLTYESDALPIALRGPANEFGTGTLEEIISCLLLSYYHIVYVFIILKFT